LAAGVDQPDVSTVIKQRRSAPRLPLPLGKARVMALAISARPADAPPSNVMNVRRRITR
jgi:hypothetical protein